MGITRLFSIVAVASIALGAPGLSLAQDLEYCFAPSGPLQACTGFPVKIDVFFPTPPPAANQPLIKDFRDKAGNLVRELSVAGQGNTLKAYSGRTSLTFGCNCLLAPKRPVIRA